MPFTIAWPAEGAQLSVDEAARVVGVSRAWLYQRVTSGELPSFVLARRRYVLGEELRKWHGHHVAGSAPK